MDVTDHEAELLSCPHVVSLELLCHVSVACIALRLHLMCGGGVEGEVTRVMGENPTSIHAIPLPSAQ